LRSHIAQAIKSQINLGERIRVSSTVTKFWSRFRRGAALASLSLVATAPALVALDAVQGANKTAVPRVPQEIDGLIDLAADQITYDAETGIVRAIGRILIRRDGYKLEAGEIRYNEKTGTVEAFGAVTLTTPSGDRIFAPKMILKDALKQAFVEDIRLLMADGAQVMAASGTRDADAGITTMERAVYSPCKVCAEEGNTQPFWQIKAVKVTHDKNKHRLYYEDAILEILGVPVMWTPKFSHPDPTVDKASGFLPLDIQTTRNLGFYAAAPYYHIFSDSKDATITPIITTKEGLILGGEYRQHLESGKFTFGGSITYTNERDDNNVRTGRKEFRGHIESEGQFDHSKNWRSTYRLNWASDDTYLQRYDFSYADTLTSEYLLEGFFGRSYISARTIGFQGLRIEDIAGETGYALPLIDAEYISKFKPLGGTISLRGNALALYRTDSRDTQRLSVSAKWQRRWISPKGFVLDADALVRGDLYNLNDVTAPETINADSSFGGTASGAEWRNLARFSGTVSWPLVKFTKKGSHTIEPIAELTVSPRRGTPNNIVNEDSRAFELNDVNLFSPERASGFDLWEEGSRLTYGVSWKYDQGDIQTEVMVGQTWRIDSTPVVLEPGAGLEGDFSDIVGRTTISYKGWIDFEHRYRINEKSFTFRRNEIDVILGDDSKSLRVGYFKLNRNLNFINREDREEIRASGFYKFTDYWRVFGTFSRRLNGAVKSGIPEGKGNIEYSLGFAYQNDCIEVGVTLRETYTRDRDIEPGTSILFQLKLTNLG
jgi:LPS-assembly protein